MPSLKENLEIWDNKYDWSEHGEEWDGQAKYCKADYEEWKESIITNFINPYINENSSILEIGPGHGRWTRYLIEKPCNLYVVDLSKKCIGYLKQRFHNYNNIKYFFNEGSNLDMIQNSTIDIIFSFDVFVHIEEREISSYFKEFSRIMKKNSHAIIHHAGRKHASLQLIKHLNKLGKMGRFFGSLFSLNRLYDGWRSVISKELVEELAVINGLVLVKQIQSWGEKNQFNVKRWNDYITVLSI